MRASSTRTKQPPRLQTINGQSFYHRKAESMGAIALSDCGTRAGLAIGIRDVEGKVYFLDSALVLPGERDSIITVLCRWMKAYGLYTVYLASINGLGYEKLSDHPLFELINESETEPLHLLKTKYQLPIQALTRVSKILKEQRLDHSHYTGWERLSAQVSKGIIDPVVTASLIALYELCHEQVSFKVSTANW